MGHHPRLARRAIATLLISGSLVMAMTSSTMAATVIGNWKLKGGLRNTAGTTLKMTKVGDAAFQTVDVKGSQRKALVFDEGEGLRLARIPRNARRSYSISILLEFDAVDGYRRILSFGPNDRDDGLYIEDGYFDLYPNAENEGAVMGADEWRRIHLTRQGKNGRMNVYLDGAKVLTFLDSENHYLLRKGKVIFFQDNLDGDGPNEHPSGTTAAIKVWKGVKVPFSVVAQP